MDKRKKQMMADVAQHQGELILFDCCFDVVQLVGFKEGEDDYYYIYNNGLEFGAMTGVMTIIPLKDYLPAEAYGRLKAVWDLNKFSIDEK